jgi:phage tail sheath protein FI
MAPEAPGTYIEEIPSARVIQPVATSVAAFIGYTETGSVNEPAQISSWNDFERSFGNTSASGIASSVRQFFVNGGSTAWVVRVVGSLSESSPTTDELIGSEADGTGMYALDSLDPFNLLLIPTAADRAAHEAMIAYAERRRAFAILDMPPEVASIAQAESWIATAPRSANAAAYFPRLMLADPANPRNARACPNSGAVAGAYARTDAQRGVWKAPAGSDVSINGGWGPETIMTDPENRVLNPLGLNAIRKFPVFGPVVWGARTLMGPDSLASEWKYVPVKRTALMIEESVYRGLQWAVFEHNDEPLWAKIRLSVGAFMHGLFRQGAFKGATPKDAYIVKCDAETTTMNDINLGVVNVVVGFAPLRPAEFVILKFSLLVQGD